ncbi:MAG TPA: class I SAM-dependent methyltransferase [Bacteroidia bacterium]|jgi:16S rRNA (cytosine967-C5)-methyltransferase|nr:class I SAM-dependent methyltransferase [Bacteroidia bacterium]
MSQASFIHKERLHVNLVKAVIQALQQIFADGKYSDTVVKNLLKSNPKWGSKDRKFLAETVYEIVRWWRKLWMIYGKEASLSDSDLFNVIGIYLNLHGHELPQWKELESIRNVNFEDRIRRAEHNRVLRESIPDWLDELGTKELGGKWEKELHELNKPAPVIIRVNTLKVPRAKAQQALKAEDVESAVVPNHPDALQLDVRKNIFRTKAFFDGWFEVQDSSSQEVAYFLDIKPGMRVIDACAGAGGKTLHMAAIMQNKGKIIALDLHEWKLKELQKRASRAGINIIESRPITSAKVIKRLENSAERVLLDVPCTGLGVLRRSPDIKWKLDLQGVERIKQQQLQIITSYSNMLKVGGRMVYATCSILPSENEGIVSAFLAEKSEFKKVAENKILPSQSGQDGFYMAAIERTA